MSTNTENTETQDTNPQNTSTPTVTNEDNIVENAKLYLDLVKEELEYESQRKASIENRVGYFLALAGALSAFLFTIVKIPTITMNTLRQVDILILLINVLFMVFIYRSLIKSMYNFFKVLDAADYDRIDLSNISETTINDNKVVTTIRILKTYKDVAMRYRSKNNTKVDNYSKAIKDLSWGLLLIVAYYVLNNLLLIGGLTK